LSEVFQTNNKILLIHGTNGEVHDLDKVILHGAPRTVFVASALALRLVERRAFFFQSKDGSTILQGQDEV